MKLWTMIHGDCLEELRKLPENSVHVCVTSPPYFALRSYLPKDHPDKAKEIGSEPTPEAFIATMVEVFREVRRVLRDDGVCWVNLGDSYADNTKWGGKSGGKNSTSAAGGYQRERRSTDCDPKRGVAAPGQPKPRTANGQLQNIPHRVAEALRQDGWIWRQTIVWSKRSPMPESVNGWRWMRCRVKVKNGVDVRDVHSGQKPHGDDIRERDGRTNWSPCPGCPKCEPHGGYVLRRGSGRCTTAHEYLFLMTKTNRYFWDGEASKENASVSPHSPGNKCNSGDGHLRNDFGTEAMTRIWGDGGRNPRSVWTLSSEPTSVRHFATYPSELVRRCLASAPTKVCPTCGAPWAPVVESERVATRPGNGSKVFGAMNPESPYMDHSAIGNRDPQRHCTVTSVKEYLPTCSCPAHEPIGGTVLDPFCGIGTTGQTACFLGMRFIGIDLNEEYLGHAEQRIDEPPRWWLRQQKAKPKRRTKSVSQQGRLF